MRLDLDIDEDLYDWSQENKSKLNQIFQCISDKIAQASGENEEERTLKKEVLSHNMEMFEMYTQIQKDMTEIKALIKLIRRRQLYEKE